jgi:hypothetical protein
VRTTLTLDDDVAAALEAVQKARQGSFREVVNEALRMGLTAMASRKPRRLFRTETASLGRSRIGSLDDIAGALAIGEGESFR